MDEPAGTETGKQAGRRTEGRGGRKQHREDKSEAGMKEQVTRDTVRVEIASVN